MLTDSSQDHPKLFSDRAKPTSRSGMPEFAGFMNYDTLDIPAGGVGGGAPTAAAKLLSDTFRAWTVCVHGHARALARVSCYPALGGFYGYMPLQVSLRLVTGSALPL